MGKLKKEKKRSTAELCRAIASLQNAVDDGHHVGGAQCVPVEESALMCGRLQACLVVTTK